MDSDLLFLLLCCLIVGNRPRGPGPAACVSLAAHVGSRLMLLCSLLATVCNSLPIKKGLRLGLIYCHCYFKFPPSLALAFCVFHWLLCWLPFFLFLAVVVISSQFFFLSSACCFCVLLFMDAVLAAMGSTSPFSRAGMFCLCFRLLSLLGRCLLLLPSLAAVHLSCCCLLHFFYRSFLFLP